MSQVLQRVENRLNSFLVRHRSSVVFFLFFRNLDVYASLAKWPIHGELFSFSLQKAQRNDIEEIRPIIHQHCPSCPGKSYKRRHIALLELRSCGVWPIVTVGAGC